MRIAWIICLIFLQLSLSETPDFGYNPPGNLHLALTGDPTQMVVSWMTTLPTVESIVTVTSHGTFNGTQSSYLLSAGWVHHVLITGLQPSSRYSYQCGSAKNGMSSTYHFNTAPAVGSTKEINIIVYGDEGIFEYSYFTVAHVTEIVTNSRLTVDFIYHVGDFGYGNDRASMWYEFSWNVFFEQNQLIMTTLPYMTLPGNHEEDCGQSTCNFYANNFTVYNYRFNMPNEQSGSPTNMWYSFNYGNIHFVSISTETDYPNCPFPTDTFGDQLAWLETDLAAASTDSNIDWIIVGGHRPMYSSCSGKSSNGIPTEDSLAVQQAFEPLFHQYGVDVYFDGHVHGYERTYPVYQSQVLGTNTLNEYYNPPATVYVVNGNAGNVEGFYTSWVTQPSWSANRLWPNPVHGFGLLTVDGANQLRWTWYKNNNQTIDNDYFDWFVITRNTTAVPPASPPADIPK